MAKRKRLTNSKNTLLWVKAGGRCEFQGCNKILYRDAFIPSYEFNFADRGHIIANSPDGPRGDKTLSKKFDDDICNIMLLCKECHKRIDSDIKHYTVDKLRKMKKQHEERIERVTGIIENNRTNIIIYSANISLQTNPVDLCKAEFAVIKNNMYPTELRPIDLSMSGNEAKDDQEIFWQIEPNNLVRRFERKLKDRIADITERSHFSVFALAPIPLLIKLGSLLTDKTNIQVYQKIREPDTWTWLEDSPDLRFSITRPFKKHNNIILILSVSAFIPDVDVLKTFGENTSVWRISVETPNNDCIRNKSHLSKFRKVFREVLQEIKTEHGAETIIHVFPAVPVSIAIEMGRVWMPKADLPMIIYDRNREDNLSFINTITIGVYNEENYT